MSPATETALPKSRALQPEIIRAKCEYFVDVQLWPLHHRIDSDGWLSNFTSHEMPYALHLLNSFVYFPDHFLDQMVRRAIREVSAVVAAPGAGSYEEVRTRWRDFLAGVRVSFPTDEVPNPTDSGHDFARRVRELGIPETQIHEPADLAARICAGLKPTGVLFVDDFVGTGNQFAAMWDRPYPVERGATESLRSLCVSQSVDGFYLPLFCTERGRQRLATDAPEVRVMEGHLITERYSALNVDGIIWPESLAEHAKDFIRDASVRAGIPDTGGFTTDDWRGFASLGLTLAFGRFVPDATLPIFYWEENGWRPLIRRH
jgi:hypothetical protein